MLQKTDLWHSVYHIICFSVLKSAYLLFTLHRTLYCLFCLAFISDLRTSVFSEGPSAKILLKFPLSKFPILENSSIYRRAKSSSSHIGCLLFVCLSSFLWVLCCQSAARAVYLVYPNMFTPQKIFFSWMHD